MYQLTIRSFAFGYSESEKVLHRLEGSLFQASYQRKVDSSSASNGM